MIMKSQFITAWHEARKNKQSNVIAGLDPALFEIGHGERGLPEEADLLAWCSAYIDAVEPYVVGIKINQAYFQGVGYRGILEELMHKIRNFGLLAISDNKLADIGNTNEAWIYFNSLLKFDALTIAPYGGNIEEAIAMTHKAGMAAITLGLMSNPEYRTEMMFISSETSEPLWQSRVRRAVEARVDAIVVGGTYTTADQAFVELVATTNDTEVLYLVPGIGAQGGSLEAFLASGINPEKCMINSGRAVMFPNGSGSTPAEQAEAAESLRDMFTTIAYAE